MASGHTVSFAESAVRDLEVIRTWYTELGAPDVAERLLREVVSAVERLRDFPLSGRVVPEFGITGLREIVDPPFRIVYRIDGERVRVVRVWRSERLLKGPPDLDER